MIASRSVQPLIKLAKIKERLLTFIPQSVVTLYLQSWFPTFLELLRKVLRIFRMYHVRYLTTRDRWMPLA